LRLGPGVVWDDHGQTLFYVNRYHEFGLNRKRKSTNRKLASI